jgi:hypothetical protein
MTFEKDDLTFRQLTRLTVLEPDTARSIRVRERCRAAIYGAPSAPNQCGAPSAPNQCDAPSAPNQETASGRLIGILAEPGLTYALSVGYLVAVTVDVLRVFLRR